MLPYLKWLLCVGESHGRFTSRLHAVIECRKRNLCEIQIQPPLGQLFIQKSRVTNPWKLLYIAPQNELSRYSLEWCINTPLVAKSVSAEFKLTFHNFFSPVIIKSPNQDLGPIVLSTPEILWGEGLFLKSLLIMQGMMSNRRKDGCGRHLNRLPLCMIWFQIPLYIFSI